VVEAGIALKLLLSAAVVSKKDLRHHQKDKSRFAARSATPYREPVASLTPTHLTIT